MWAKYRGREVLPLWIVGMDFPAPVADLADLLVDDHRRRYGWPVHPGWITWVPGLVLGLNLAVEACCAVKTQVISFPPVYPLFLQSLVWEAPGRSSPTPACGDVFAPRCGICCRRRAVSRIPRYAGCSPPASRGDWPCSSGCAKTVIWRTAALARMRLAHTCPTVGFLIWIDARELTRQVGNAAIWFEARGVGLSDGGDFGSPDYLRLNFAAPPSLLNEALARTARAMASR